MRQIRNYFALAFGFLMLVATANTAMASGVLINHIRGVSDVDLSDGFNPVVYAGLMGSVTNGECGSATSTDSTCSNCVFGSGLACNTNRIHGSLYLSIEFLVTAELKAPTKLNVGYTASGEAMPTNFSGRQYVYEGSHPIDALLKGSTGRIRIPWSAICSESPDIGDWNCEDPTIDIANFRLFLGLQSSSRQFPIHQTGVITIKFPNVSSADTDILDCTGASASPGFCEFVTLPGQNRVKIDNLVQNGRCPGNYKSLRVYHSSVSFDEATYGGSFTDLPMNADCSLGSDGYVAGLPSAVTQFFRVSVVDMAGNNYYLTNPVSDISGINAVCGALSTPPTPAEDLACDYIATPDSIDQMLNQISMFQ